ncbi:restriction endonuclease [Rhizobium sp. 007]|uniref:restriction endonuclease n=1 Tax=Rhizobium sp. 007 TaxID=2785056 RepID=UPI001FEF124A|nr:restriction endonuclease [Rhizobium sp. 007]
MRRRHCRPHACGALGAPVRIPRPQRRKGPGDRCTVALSKLDRSSLRRCGSKASQASIRACCRSSEDRGHQAELLQVSSLSAQARGFAFEGFLKGLFDAYGLAAQEPFRLRGEQIGGSFQLGSDIYLLEAKWHGQPIGVADLHTFHVKIEQKAAWTRGLFVSNSGFSEDGLVAFGRGKRVICMDGLDLYEMLDREIPLNQVLERKVRRAAETGMPFLRVRDLFPG